MSDLETAEHAATFRCPSCGDAHSMEIAASMWVRLIQHKDGTTETEPSKTDASHEWDKDSIVVCTNCRWSGAMVDADRREYLRGELRAGTMSYGELAELQDLADKIDPGDVELLEAAGVPEFPEEG